MTAPPWLIRAARSSDRELLGSFSCSGGGGDWSAEVQKYVRSHLLNYSEGAGRHLDSRVLLLFARPKKGRRATELVGVASHHIIDLTDGTSEVTGTYVQVLAIADAWQGRAFDDGSKASEVLASALVMDIQRRRPRRDQWIVAKVHEQNTRAIKLCQKLGLTGELPADPPYRFLRSQSRTSH